MQFFYYHKEGEKKSWLSTGTSPQLGVMIDEFYMSSNSQHVNNEKEYENFHGCTFVDVQVLNGVQIEQKKKFMQFTMIS
jgi:hypothetical protein